MRRPDPEEDGIDTIQEIREPIKVTHCPKCKREYDRIEMKHQSCNRCGHEAQEECIKTGAIFRDNTGPKP